jgi:hypothetical protein
VGSIDTRPSGRWPAGCEGHPPRRARSRTQKTVVCPFLVQRHMHALEHGLAPGVRRPSRPSGNGASADNFSRHVSLATGIATDPL